MAAIEVEYPAGTPLKVMQEVDKLVRRQHRSKTYNDWEQVGKIDRQISEIMEKYIGQSNLERRELEDG